MFELQSLQGILRQSEFPIWQNQLRFMQIERRNLQKARRVRKMGTNRLAFTEKGTRFRFKKMIRFNAGNDRRTADFDRRSGRVQDQMKRAPDFGRSFLLFQFFVQHVIGKISRFFKHVPREFRRVVISHEIGHILLPINSMGRERAVYS